MAPNLNNQFFDTISKRKSIRDFLPDAVEQEKLDRLLLSIQRSPSAANCQPWHFIVLQGPDKEKINHLFQHKGFQAAPLALAACAEPGVAWVRQEDGVNFSWVDVSIAVTELTLAATALGLGSCWVAAMDVDAVKKTLKIPDHIDFVSMVVLGYPRESLKMEPKNRKPFESFVHSGSFG